MYVVGGLGVDSIDQLKLLSKTELEVQLGISLGPRYALVTYHPDTINPDKSLDQLDTILRSIAKFPEIQFIITGANADYYGDQINLRLKDEAKQQTNVQFFNSVGQQNYLSLLSRANFVLGNSSSGLLEAPSFGTTTINIGGRQDGRPRASSVVDVECEETQLVKVIQSVISASPGSTLQSVENAYGNPGASKKITEILDALDLNNLLPKRFFDLK